MMRLSLAVFLICVLAGNPVSAANVTKTYKVDSGHTRVLFFADHLGFMKMPGTASGIEGKLTFNLQDNQASNVSVTIDATKITMQHDVLDKKLQGKEFFNTAKFPKITFESTVLEKTGMDTGVMTGNLTLLGVTKPIKLDVKLNKRGWNKYMGKEVIGLSATGKLRRSDFGMKAYLPDVGDDIVLMVEIEAHEVRPQDAAMGK